MLKRVFGAIFAITMLGTSGAFAAEETQRYDVYAGGIKLGTLGMNAQLNSNGYGVSARVAGGGLLGVFVKFDFSGQAQGRIAGNGTLGPLNYTGTSDNGKVKRTVSFGYRNGVPRNVSFSPARTPRPHDVGPEAQRGTLDPISATLALLRSLPVGQACGKSVDVFDGSKRSRLRMGARQATSDGLFVCNGTYSRIAGFSPKLMAKQQNFSFSTFWREQDGVMQVVRFQTQTTFGTVTAVRR